MSSIFAARWLSLRFFKRATVNTIVLLITVPALGFAATGSQGTPVRKGPPGVAFYTPPSPLPAGRHGDLIWARHLSNNAALPAAARNWLVLYRSISISGKPVVVSGTVAIPKGTPPAGGWPVISWTHGTVGIADKCAPSRNDSTDPARGYINLPRADLNRWVKKGYAVVATDYEGLGTPGIHPYLVAQSEARGATDIVYAARQLNSQLSRDWLVMGHSQGGGAAVYTSFLGPIYGQGLDLKGAIAISPDVDVSQQMEYTEAHIDKLPASAGLPVLFAGAASQAPGVDLSKMYTRQGKKIAKMVDHRCLAGIRGYMHAHDVTKMKQLLDPHADYSAINKVFESLVDVQNLRPSVPLLVLQADNDEVAVKHFTDIMIDRFRILGVPLDYHVIHIGDRGSIPSYHQATIPETRQYAMSWATKRLPAGH